MTLHERISRDLKRLKDTGKLVLQDPEILSLKVETLSNGRYEITYQWQEDDEPESVIVQWSTVIAEATSFYKQLEQLETL
jgi:hypothetical protein